jgi:hypothetical protein
VTDNLPAKYYWQELKTLLGDYKPKAEMPCWRCNTPEGTAICWGFAQMAGATIEQRVLPPGTAPMLEAVASDLEDEPTPTSPAIAPSLESQNLFMLRDRVLSGDRLKAAAIKAAGGIRALARKLGTHPEFIERWEHIPAKRLQAVATITGLPQHVLRPDLFPGVDEPQSYWRTKEEEDEAWAREHAQQLWLPLPYPPGFLPAHCCARRPQLTLVVNRREVEP